jgi:energy-coupling factor transport system ATP-binding protein
LIEIRNLKHQFDRMDKEGTILETNLALNGINLNINEGEFIAVLGHNGSGKSTLARHMNAILLPDEGEVLIDGMKTENPEQIWDIRKKVAMVFQNPDNQMVATTVEEEIAFGLENQRLDAREIQDRVTQALRMIDMTEYRKSSPHELSGGQKQKVVIAGAVAVNPKYLILDEPTAMLDPLCRDGIIKILKRLQTQYKMTIILVTHYMEEVVYADRVIVMNQGSIVESGSPVEIFSDVEKMEKYRLDVPVVTKLAYELQKKGISLKKGIMTREELVGELCQLDWKM